MDRMGRNVPVVVALDIFLGLVATAVATGVGVLVGPAEDGPDAVPTWHLPHDRGVFPVLPV